MKETAKDALLEIGTEELPSRFISPAAVQIRSKAEVLLKEKLLSFKELEVWTTPRRLALLIRELSEKSQSQVQEITGPPARLWKDSEGRFTPQSEGFARSHGIAPQDLVVVSTARGECLAVRRTLTGLPAEKLLPDIFLEVLRSISFPKNMVWEESRFRFARPIRNLAALYGNKIIPLAVAGVRSGRTVLSPYFDGARKVKIEEPRNYMKQLQNCYVYVSPSERREKLQKSVEHVLRSKKLDALCDEELLEEVTDLTEFPNAVLGEFQSDYLSLPRELLVTVLKKQLKFFPVVDSSDCLQPYFVGVRNGLSEKQDVVRRGFERVVAARLADAKFFFQKDSEKPLMEYAKNLPGILFHEKLGTLEDKTQRVKRLTDRIGSELEQQGIPVRRQEAVRIAQLAYADLTTELVREFPELQGILGGIYALKSGEPLLVAEGIRDFYKPLNAAAELPRSLEGAVVSLAAKLDTLAGDFAIELVPTGSEDPHGLRRQAIGVLRILVEKEIPIPLRTLTHYALQQITGNDEAAVKTTALPLYQFFMQRLENYWVGLGYPVDEIRSVEAGILDNLPQTWKKLRALHEIRKEADFQSLAISFKRAANILKQADWDKRNPGQESDEVDVTLLAGKSELLLNSKIEEVRRKVEPLAQKGEYACALREMVSLKTEVDAFFDEVMVMVDDERLRNNRLRMLARLRSMFKDIADFSRLQ